MSFCSCVSFIAARMRAAKSMFITCILVEKVGASVHAIGKCGFDLFAGMKGAQHDDRFNGRQSKRGGNVRSEAREAKHPDVKLLTSFLHDLQIRARVMPETELERVPHDGLLDLLAMCREEVSDRGANEVGAVGVEALLNQQIDVTKVHVAEVDRDLLAVARSFAKALNLSSQSRFLHPCGWYMDDAGMDFKRL